MSNLVLVDSCFYIQLLGQRVNPLARLMTAAEQFEYDFAICGIVWMEVLRGRSDPFVRDRFNAGFETMRFLNLTPQTWQRAAALAWEMDRAGDLIPATDLAIAACAIEHDAVVLTFDRHFQKVPGLLTTDHLL